MASPTPPRFARRDFFRRLALGLPMATAVALLASSPLTAAELRPAEAGNLRVSFPAPDGWGVMRRLRAESATGLRKAMTLRQGQVDFFTATSGQTAVAWMKFEEARYDSVSESVTSESLLRFESHDGAKLTGRGYVYENRKNRLTLRSEVTGEFLATLLAAPECEVHFDPKQAEENIIREVWFGRGVTVTGAEVEKAGYRILRATKARYRADTGLLDFKGGRLSGVDTKGVEAEMESDAFTVPLFPPSPTSVAKP